MEFGEADEFSLRLFGRGLGNTEQEHELMQHLGGSMIVIFLYGVTNIVNNSQLESALHLSDG